MPVIKSYPFFSQKDDLDCGAACLRMVARYYNRFFSQAYLRELTFLSPEGVSLLDISEAAEQIGMRTLAAKINFDQLRDEVPLPCIIHWKGYHFVVVYEVSDRKVVIGDPAVDLLEMGRQEFELNWLAGQPREDQSGVALLLETTPEFAAPDEEPTDKKSIRYIFQILRKFKSLKTQLILGAVFTGILQFAAPFFIMAMVDVGITNEDFSFIWLVLFAMLALFLSQTTIEFLRGRIINHIGSHLNLTMLTDFLVKLMRLPMRFFDSHTVGDLFQRVSDNDRLERFISSSALFSLFSLINVVLFGIVLLAFDWKIFLVFFFGTLAQLNWIRLFWRKRRELDFKRFEQAAINNNYLFDIIRGMQDIKLNNAERQRRWMWEKQQARLFRNNLRSLNVELWQSRGASFFNELKNIIIIALAAQQVLLGEMTFGMMLAAVYILGQLNAPIDHLVEFVQSMQGASNSLERMGEVHDLEEDEKSSEKINSLQGPKNLFLENVSFRYKGSQSPLILDDVEVNIPEGKITAIIGPSGSGKTTLVKLLLGIYRPTEGTVKVGDINIANISNHFWRSKTAAVLQDSYIFSETVAKNIALADEIFNAEQVVRAIKIANLQSWVDSLPQNYNTRIEEDGSKISYGIKQKILIARAIYKNPEFLFLDEATSNLDMENEMTILENLKHSLAGTTIVLVAHRLNTIKFADQIIVLKDGEIKEVGTHSELYEKGGPYFQFVKRQF